MNTSVPLLPQPTLFSSGLRIVFAGAGLVFGVGWFAQESWQQALIVAITLGLGVS
ncbi:MAG: hypothetical protein HWE34_14790 [Methylocystaceae bacterium]|nr:hypothetical protein [Methylocystaceae bacterium]